MSHAPPFHNDEDLLDGLRRNAPGAFEAFFERFADRVYGFGLKISGRPEEAREITRECFAGALRSLKQIRSAKSLERHVFRAAAGTCLASRRSGSSGGADAAAGVILPSSSDGRPAFVHDWSLDPDEETRRPQEKEMVKEAVAGLPMEDRLAVVLRDMEEMSDHAAAEILRVPVTVFKDRLRRGRLQIRRELTRHLGKEEDGAATS